MAGHKGKIRNRRRKVRNQRHKDRQSKNISFIAINDGSTVHNLQIVAEHEKIKKDFLKLVTTGSAIRVDGMFVLSTGNQQHGEIIAQNIVLYGTADPQEYPLQK